MVKRRLNSFLAALLICILICTFSLSGAAFAGGQTEQEKYEQAERYRLSPDPVTMIADGLLVRPLGLVTMVVGSVGYVLSLPFSIPSDSEDEVRQQLVEYPAWFTFKRPMGHFGHRLESTAEYMPMDRERVDREAEEARQRKEAAKQEQPLEQEGSPTPSEVPAPPPMQGTTAPSVQPAGTNP